ncbi:WD40 repeat-like protein [Hesseltinella vesiculosa]|uniref:WD40 repeat-like protein n=1 Tax=Hesseltinella vesiculosa TaxID=101127 RepID=A0A1X2GBD5_9FUNG|nr:WD40 repeat-like protein [Hesseltinella vesiculosa]
MRKQGKSPGLSSSFASNSSLTASTSQGRMQRLVAHAALGNARLSTESQQSLHGSVASSDVVNVYAHPTPSLRTRMSGAISSLALSPGGDAVVIAGREILKILTVTPEEVTETLNLRVGSQSTLNFSSNDVKWGNNATKSKIATAATNGSILIWDIYRVGRKVDRIINEHARAVNRICFQPENGHILLSASQDGTMRCWDLRDSRSGAKLKFEGKSESVRDVQFNPVVHYDFAAAFETGTLQKWDMRNPKAMYDRKVSAHNGPCLTVDWHPTGRLVATGGRDKTIKVWDLNSDNRRPLYMMRTMAAVSRVQWRPDHDDEIASCALNTEKRIHIWDVRRPNIPKYAFDEHESTPTGFLWFNNDVIYSVAKDKYFIRQHIQSAYQPIDILRHNSLCWNIQGDLALAVDNSPTSEFVDSTTTRSSMASAAKIGKRTTSKPAAPEDAVQYIPQQTCAIGHLPLFDYETFTVFAENYEISDRDLAHSCEMNSQLAWKLGHYRTSQSWRIVSVLFQDAAKGKDTPNNDQQLAELMSNDMLSDTNESISRNGHPDQNAPLENNTDQDTFNEPPPSNLSRKDLWPAWQHDKMVHELFDFYTEQGDVQTCVTLYLVLRKYITIDEHRVVEWFTSYIDILRRLKLWTAVNAIINASDIPHIQEQNQASSATTIHITCSNCFKLVSGTAQGAWACDKCHRLLNPCSICHQTVKSLYVWCQGCNHGGHLDHMHDWFADEKECPTGCGHQCVL